MVEEPLLSQIKLKEVCFLILNVRLSLGRNLQTSHFRCFQEPERELGADAVRPLRAAEHVGAERGAFLQVLVGPHLEPRFPRQTASDQQHPAVRRQEEGVHEHQNQEVRDNSSCNVLLVGTGGLRVLCLCCDDHNPPPLPPGPAGALRF